MINKFKSHLSVENFFQDCENFKVDKQTFDYSYRDFLKYFNDIKVITKHNLVIGINFAYGWMPTIFDFRSDEFDAALLILNNAKKGIVPTIEQLEILKGLFNNSLVGTSKILHFINPEKFAIWDSRGYRYLTGEEPHGYRMGDCNSYLAYLAFCDYLTKVKNYEKVHLTICQKLGYPMSKYRTAEMIMYLNGNR